MEDTTKILGKASSRANGTEGGDPCLVNLYPNGPTMGTRYSLGGTPVVLGRDVECQIRINDESVSRRHASIQPDADGYSVMDLRSTNGTFVNQVRVSAQRLKDGDYLHVGNAIFRYLAGGNVEAEYHEEIYRLTIIDALTGVHNKRYLLELLARDLACSARYRRPLALVLFDIDHFKAINDEFGHLAGDFILRELAARLQQGIRKEDLFARYGGDEFVVVMPETTGAEAVHLAQRLRDLAENHRLEYAGKPFQVTISLGVAAATGEEWLTSSEFLRQADDKLYQAKHEGRNRVAI